MRALRLMSLALLGLAACAQIVGADFDDYRLDDASSSSSTSASSSGMGGSSTASTSSTSSGMGGMAGGGGGGGSPDLCGNGMLDAGETCDGDCPTSCVDGNKCTNDQLNGSATTCDAVCAAPSVGCGANDGCCPSNCMDFQDPDCPTPALDTVLVVGNGDPGFLDDTRNGLVATGRFGSVQTLSGELSAVTLAALTPYDAVLVFANNNAWLDPVATGDALADYYDGGGRVVVAMAAHCGIFSIGGRFVTGNYLALSGPDFNNDMNTAISAVHEPASYLFAGVNQANLVVDAYCNATLSAGAVSIASWNGMNGPVPAFARKEVGSRWRVDLNLFAPNASPDEFELIANALYFE